LPRVARCVRGPPALAPPGPSPSQSLLAMRFVEASAEQPERTTLLDPGRAGSEAEDAEAAAGAVPAPLRRTNPHRAVSAALLCSAAVCLSIGYLSSARQEARRREVGLDAQAVLGLADAAAVGRSAGVDTGALLGLAEGGGNEPSFEEGDQAVYIRWQAKTELCLDVWGDHAGAMVQLWHCKDLKGANVTQEREFKWTVPPVGEEGFIKWAGNTTLCLDAPEHNEIQLWYCKSAPEAHTKWKIDSKGKIQLAKNPSKCLDVTSVMSITDGDFAELDGNKLQLVECAEDKAEGETDTQKFHAYTKDCQWASWSDWSECTVSCGGGDRFQRRVHRHEADAGGKACEGDSSRSSGSPCNPDGCPGDPTTMAYRPAPGDPTTKAPTTTSMSTPATTSKSTPATTTTTQAPQGGGGFFFR